MLHSQKRHFILPFQIVTKLLPVGENPVPANRKQKTTLRPEVKLVVYININIDYLVFT